MSVPGTFSEADRLQVLVGYFKKNLLVVEAQLCPESASAQSWLRGYHSVGLCYAPGLDGYQLFAIKDSNNVHYMSDVGARHPYVTRFFIFFFIAKPIVPFWKLGNLAL